MIPGLASECLQLRAARGPHTRPGAVKPFIATSPPSPAGLHPQTATWHQLWAYPIRYLLSLNNRPETVHPFSSAYNPLRPPYKY